MRNPVTLMLTGLLLWSGGAPLQAQPVAATTATQPAAASTTPLALATADHPAAVPTPLAGSPVPTPVQPISAEAAALMQVFGQREGLHRMATEFGRRMRSDTRTAKFFANTKLQSLADQLADQFCQVLGGGCRYVGDTMKAAHAGLGIARADFLAAVEILQAAMDAQGIPFAAQNRLLVQLAPMHRDSVNTR